MCPGGAASSTKAGSGKPCPSSIGSCYHGTHVAGIAAGNTTGIAGVARGAKLISIQVFTRFDTAGSCAPQAPPCLRSYTSDQIKAMERVYALRTAYKVASVNLSLGGGLYTEACDAQNPAMTAAIQKLRGVGIATVIAAGNDGLTGYVSAPGCISSAVTVGSTTKTDTVSSFSNLSPAVDILAPGSSITSALPGGAYGIASGTSMATPHIAGAYAVMRSAKPTASLDQNPGRPPGKPHHARPRWRRPSADRADQRRGQAAGTACEEAPWPSCGRASGAGRALTACAIYGLTGPSMPSDAGMVREWPMREQITTAVPESLLDGVIEQFHPVRVILFGSRARGDARPDSDYDLLVIVDDDLPDARRDGHAVNAARGDYRGSVDILPWRRSLYDAQRGVVGSLPWTANREGVVVYGSRAESLTGDPAGMRTTVAGDWLRAASEDLHVARICLASSPPAVSSAAFHCQQCAEKLIKAALILAETPFPRLDKLAETGPAPSGERARANGWSHAACGRPYALGASGRYPGAAELSDKPPTLQGVETAISDLEVLQNLVRAAPSGSRANSRFLGSLF